MPDLKTILRLNAASCFGAIFAIFPRPTAAFLGSPPAPAWLVGAVGAVLVINGLHLLLVSRRVTPSKVAILYFSGGDFAWVLGTIALIASGLWINHPGGQLAALVVAAFVGVMGTLQIVTRGKLGRC